MDYSPQRLRDAAYEAAILINPRVFVTLAFNFEVTFAQADRYLLAWAHRVERAAHGKRWSRFPAGKRIRLYAFPEHMTSNFHYHVVLVGSPAICEAALEAGPDIWRELTKTGHADAQWIRNQMAASRYVTKAVKRREAFENFVAYAPNTPCKA